MSATYRYVFFGLSITSSWGNGHATTYRALIGELCARGHDVLFLERDLPFYADNRDLPRPPYGRVELYRDLDELYDRFATEVRSADMTIVGSFVPDGVRVGSWVNRTARGRTAFYDIDTPVTLRKLERGDEEYLSAALARRYDLYLSFTGGPLLDILRRRYGANPRPLHCSADPTLYVPARAAARWDLGYIGTYSPDRQAALERLLVEPARRWDEGRFVVAGPQYPAGLSWPPNVERTSHLSPHEHPAFYNAQRFTLNVTRADMIAAGYSPSVRLFEAAACGTPVISDVWPGLETFFEPGTEILLAQSTEDALRYVRWLPDEERIAVGLRARQRALREHTAAHRAETLEAYTRELLEKAGARANA